MDEVRLVDYDPAWPALFTLEAARLRSALPSGMVLGVEHFGSTSIPGMVAKPIIDILVVVQSIEAARAHAVVPLEALGYAFWADNPKRDRLFFVRGLPPAPHRTHHVHMTEPDSKMWRRLPFRNYLRAHADEAGQYAALKRDLAARHTADREAYTAAKAAYVDEILAKAHASTPGPA